MLLVYWKITTHVKLPHCSSFCLFQISPRLPQLTPIDGKFFLFIQSLRVAWLLLRATEARKSNQLRTQCFSKVTTKGSGHLLILWFVLSIILVQWWPPYGKCGFSRTHCHTSYSKPQREFVVLMKLPSHSLQSNSIPWRYHPWPTVSLFWIPLQKFLQSREREAFIPP